MIQCLEIYKTADYLRRTINKGFDTGYSLIGPLYTIIEQFEKIGDQISILCDLLIDSKYPDEDIKLINEFKLMIDDYISFKKHKDLLNNPIKIGNKLVNHLSLMFQTLININGPIIALNI